ncbi:MAG TPA: hypothetical protein VJ982_01130 [Gemmatimonadota bacterium]|nr:hypothetical protein [Gemmatimonadota bacterium]
MIGRNVALGGFLGMACALSACGGGEIAEAVRPAREPGELALPPSANAPRVSRDATAPDTFRPDSVDEFAIVDLDSFPFGDSLPGPTGAADAVVESVADSYRRHYEESLHSEGSAVRGGIDRELQRRAELMTAHERGFPDWIGMIEALTPQQRAQLVGRLNEANIGLADDLHGPADASPEAAPAGPVPNGPAADDPLPPGE